MTRSMATAYMFGRTADSMKVSGTTESSMERVSIDTSMAKKEGEDGKTESAWHGLMVSTIRI